MFLFLCPRISFMNAFLTFGVTSNCIQCLNILQGDVSKCLFRPSNLSLKTYKYLKLCEKHIFTKLRFKFLHK